MPVARPVPLPLLHHIRLWLAVPLVYRLVMLGSAVLIGHGYAEIMTPTGNLEQVTRQVVGGIMTVVLGAGLVGMLTFWRD